MPGFISWHEIDIKQNQIYSLEQYTVIPIATYSFADREEVAGCSPQNSRSRPPGISQVARMSEAKDMNGHVLPAVFGLDDPVGDRAALSWRALIREAGHHRCQRARLFCHPSRIRLDLIRVSWI